MEAEQSPGAVWEPNDFVPAPPISDAYLPRRTRYWFLPEESGTFVGLHQRLLREFVVRHPRAVPLSNFESPRVYARSLTQFYFDVLDETQEGCPLQPPPQNVEMLRDFLGVCSTDFQGDLASVTRLCPGLLDKVLWKLVLCLLEHFHEAFSGPNFTELKESVLPKLAAFHRACANDVTAINAHLARCLPDGVRSRLALSVTSPVHYEDKLGELVAQERS